MTDKGYLMVEAKDKEGRIFARAYYYPTTRRLRPGLGFGHDFGDNHAMPAPGTRSGLQMPWELIKAFGVAWTAPVSTWTI